MSGERIRRAGSDALIVDCDDLDHALAVFAVLGSAREAGSLRADELIVGAQTVLIRGVATRHRAAVRSLVMDALTSRPDLSSSSTQHDETVIPVRYDGDDLHEVAEHVGMSVDEVVARHTAAAYTVAFAGFAPGFAYLSGGDPRLVVPRRATPRPRIAGGSVGLAGVFSGVYPRESPGGWQIIGSTELDMWDLDRTPPALLVTGRRVRFAVDERVRAVSADALGGGVPRESTAVAEAVEHGSAADVAAVASTGEATQATGVPSAALRVVDPGFHTVIEDAGRSDVAALGVGRSGTAILRSFRHANRLVGNDRNAAALELSHGTLVLDALTTVVLAVTGAKRVAIVTGPTDEWEPPHGVPFRLSEGEQLTLEPPETGVRSILAVRGGIEAHRVLGSRSRDTLAGLGPAPLQAGDELALAGEAHESVELADQLPDVLPAPGDRVTLRIVPGPRDDWFSADTLRGVVSTEWEVSHRSDRVGVRLMGPALERAEDFRSRELPSEGTVSGAIQVPPDGQPVMFLVDGPITGGYPVVGVVAADDLELAAQLPPGAFVTFEFVE